MLEHVHDNDPGFIVSWHSKHEHHAGKFQDKVMTWGQAHREAEKMAKEHPENTYWAEHVPQDHSPH